MQLEDPVDQLVEIHRRMNDAKELHNAVGADMLQDWSEMFGPAMFAQASRADVPHALGRQGMGRQRR